MAAFGSGSFGQGPVGGTPSGPTPSVGYGAGAYGGAGYGGGTQYTSATLVAKGLAPYGGAPYGGEGTTKPAAAGGAGTAFDAFGISDVAATSSLHTHIAVSDAVSIGDSARFSGKPLTASDAVAITDTVVAGAGLHPVPTLQKLIPGVGSHAHRRARGPTNLPRGFKTSRVNPPLSVSYGAFDAFAIGDTAAQTSLHTHLAASDAVTLTERAAVTFRTSDAITITDTVAAAVLRTRSATDTISITDSAASSAQSARAATDAVGVSDIPRAGLMAADALSVTDVPTTRMIDAITITDQAARVVTFNRTPADTITFSDSARGTLGQSSLTSQDSVNVTDQPRMGLAANDAVTLSDTGQGKLVDVIPIFDSVAPSDYVTNARVYQVAGEVPTVPASVARVYQTGAEVPTLQASEARVYQTAAEIPILMSSRAREFQVASEVVVGSIWGQIWPKGWGQTRGPNGQMWPRWSNKNGVQ